VCPSSCAPEGSGPSIATKSSKPRWPWFWEQGLYAALGDKCTLFLEALDRYVRTYGGFGPRALVEEPRARDAVARQLRGAAAAYTWPDRPHGCVVLSRRPGDVAGEAG